MKSLTFLGNYTAEETPQVISVLDRFVSENNAFLKYLHFPTKHNFKVENWLKILYKNNVDCFRFGQEFYKDIDANLLEDLSDIFEVKRINPYMRDFCLRNKKLVCIPDTIDGLILFYNKRILNELNLKVPGNWSEFRNILDKIKRNKSDLIPFALHNLRNFKGWWAYYLIQPFLVQAGIDFDTLNIKDLFNTDEMKEVLNFLKSLVDANLLDVLDDKKYKSRSINAFTDESAIFILEGPWSLSAVEEKNPKLLEDIGFTVLKHKNQRTILGGRYFALLKESRNTNLTKGLLKSFTDHHGYYESLSNKNKIPGYQGTFELGNYTKRISKLYDKYGVIEVMHENEAEISEEIGDKIGEIISSWLL